MKPPGAGLIAWEFMQLSGILTFDPYDLAATGAGVLTASFFYLRFRPAASLGDLPDP